MEGVVNASNQACRAPYLRQINRRGADLVLVVGSKPTAGTMRAQRDCDTLLQG